MPRENLKQDFANLFATLRSLPPRKDVDDGAWKDLFDLSYEKYGQLRKDQFELKADDPVTQVSYLVKEIVAIQVAAQKSKLLSLLDFLPDNSAELLALKHKLIRLRDIIQQSAYAGNFYVGVSFNKFYKAINDKLQAGSQEKKESEAESAAPHFTMTKESVESCRRYHHKKTSGKNIFKPYKVTNALEKGNISAAIHALAELGVSLQRKYGDSPDYAALLKREFHEGFENFFSAELNKDASAVLRAIWDAYDNIQSGPEKDKHQAWKTQFLIGLNTWTQLFDKPIATKESLPETSPDKTAVADVLFRDPSLKPREIATRVNGSLRKLQPLVAEYKRYLEEEIRIRLETIYSPQMKTVHDVVGVVVSDKESKANAAEVLLQHWDTSAKVSYVETHLKIDNNFSLLMEKYKKITELNDILANTQKDPFEKAANFASKLSEYQPTFEKHRDDGWKAVGKVIVSTVVFMLSLPLLAIPYYYLHQELWKSKGKEFVDHVSQEQEEKPELSENAKIFKGRMRQ